MKTRGRPQSKNILDMRNPSFSTWASHNIMSEVKRVLPYRGGNISSAKFPGSSGRVMNKLTRRRPRNKGEW